ncbi:MAG: alpha/beta fold hydrolase [Hyphomicrobium sp.]
MLWDRPDDPRAALRWSLSKLRGALGGQANWIVADRERVSFEPGDGWIDLLAAREAAETGSPSAALAVANLLIEPPLLGLDLPDLDAWSAWLQAERASLERLRATLLRRAAAAPGVSADQAARYLAIAAQADPEGPADLVAGERVDSPALSQTVHYCRATDGVRLAYACTGEGSPLVKAANWLGHLELDWASPFWGRMYHELSANHLLVRYDERGNGLSDWDCEDLSFEAFVRDLEVVVDHLELDRFPLLGISQGCAVSIEYACRHPHRVSHLILVGGYAAGWRLDADAATAAQREATITLVRHGWGENNPAYRQIFSHTFFPSATADEVDWFNDFQRRIASAENAARFLETFSRIDVRRRLSEVKQPTLVLHSRGDQRITLDHGRELAAAIAGAELVTLDSDSHLPLGREFATDQLLDHVRRFLAT